MEEKQREVEELNSLSASTMPFSDEIPSTNLSFPYPLGFSTTAATTNIFDMMMPSSSCDQKPSTSSFGFVDLLGAHDHDYGSSLFDWLPIATATTAATVTPVHHPLHSPASSNVPESSEVLNTTPASPNNSSSISSSSNEAAAANSNTEEQLSGKGGHEHEAGDEEGDGDGDGGRGDDLDQDKTKKQ